MFALTPGVYPTRFGDIDSRSLGESTALRAVEMAWMTSGSRLGTGLMGATVGAVSNVALQTLHSQYRGSLDPLSRTLINLGSYVITVVTMSMLSIAKFSPKNNLFWMACSVGSIALMYLQYSRIDAKRVEAFKQSIKEALAEIMKDDNKVSVLSKLSKMADGLFNDIYIDDLYQDNAQRSQILISDLYENLRNRELKRVAFALVVTDFDDGRGVQFLDLNVDPYASILSMPLRGNRVRRERMKAEVLGYALAYRVINLVNQGKNIEAIKEFVRQRGIRLEEEASVDL